MTIEQFDNHGFRAGDTCIHKGKVYPIVSLEFEEKLIGIDENISGGEAGDISWKRCENIDLA